MEEDFYKKRLIDNYGLEVLIPDEQDRNLIHSVIYNELCLGNIYLSSKNEFIHIIEKLQQGGAEGVILGCTEIPLLVKQEDVNLPLFDTTQLHAEGAVQFSLE